MYNHPFREQKDYSSFITLNDDVTFVNLDFLIQYYQTLELQKVKGPIMRAMNLLIDLQQKAPYAGWADQHTVEDLKPAHARSYEPKSINRTTVRAIHLLMEYYRLTGDKKFIAGIPSAINYLESIELPESELTKYGKSLHERKGIFVPRFIDPDTGEPLYVHRKGSNVANGCYYTDQDISNTIGHYSSGNFVDIDELRKAYNDIEKSPLSEVTKNSPLISTWKIPLPKYYTRMRSAEENQEKEIQHLIKTITKKGYWLTSINYISNPYKECPPMKPSEDTKYATTFVGDEYDTSCYTSKTPVMGISTAVYITNMIKCIYFLDKIK
jgi:hypothetical protein